MKLHKLLLLGALGLPLALFGCNDDTAPADTGTDTETGDGDGDGEGDGDGDDQGDGDGDDQGDGDGDDQGDGDGEGDGDGDEQPDPFVFSDGPPGKYVRVDRMGVPGVANLLIDSKDDYNNTDPAEDAIAPFLSEIVGHLMYLHTELQNDITDTGFEACLPANCLAQAQPLIVPDTLRLAIGDTSGFPNGRQLADPVIDMMLALLLINLNAADHDLNSLAGIPLNVPANDVDFLSEFPWLAAPN